MLDYGPSHAYLQQELSHLKTGEDILNHTTVCNVAIQGWSPSFVFKQMLDLNRPLFFQEWKNTEKTQNGTYGTILQCK